MQGDYRYVQLSPLSYNLGASRSHTFASVNEQYNLIPKGYGTVHIISYLLAYFLYIRVVTLHSRLVQVVSTNLPFSASGIIGYQCIN